MSQITKAGDCTNIVHLVVRLHNPKKMDRVVLITCYSIPVLVMESLAGCPRSEVDKRSSFNVQLDGVPKPRLGLGSLGC